MKPALKVLVIGESGQLAGALKDRDSSQIKITNLNRKQLDLSWKKEQIISCLTLLEKPDVLINAAAYTAVDNAEVDEEMALKLNSKSPTYIAEYCSQHNIPFIHISTDYVFNGRNTMPYKVTDATSPLGAYGRSKLAGEKSILGVKGRNIIIRTSWVYNGAGKNFFTTMLKLARDRREIGVVNDQFGRPTYAGHLANAILNVCDSLASGRETTSNIFHVSDGGEVISWADFAREIFKVSRSSLSHDVLVNEISTEQYPTPAKRPAYSALDISLFEKEFNLSLPHWRVGLEEALKEWPRAN